MEPNQAISDILETVSFIKDHAVTREEFSKEITEIKATMVTKDYLDDKLADLRGDLVVLMRKEDRQLQELVQMLHLKNILTQEEMKHLFKLEPFQQII